MSSSSSISRSFVRIPFFTKRPAGKACFDAPASGAALNCSSGFKRKTQPTLQTPAASQANFATAFRSWVRIANIETLEWRLCVACGPDFKTRTRNKRHDSRPARRASPADALRVPPVTFHQSPITFHLSPVIAIPVLLTLHPV